MSASNIKAAAAAHVLWLHWLSIFSLLPVLSSLMYLCNHTISAFLSCFTFTLLSIVLSLCSCYPFCFGVCRVLFSPCLFYCLVLILDDTGFWEFRSEATEFNISSKYDLFMWCCSTRLAHISQMRFFENVYVNAARWVKGYISLAI